MGLNHFAGRTAALVIALGVSGCSKAPLTSLRTGSMYPTLQRQSRCVLQPVQQLGDLRVGHVITLKLQEALVVRRVAGVPGDIIEADNGLYRRRGERPDRTLVTRSSMCLNGPSPRCTCEIWQERIGIRNVKVQRLSRTDIHDDIRCDPPLDADAVTVPAGHIYVLADNRDGAFDSRDLGPIPIRQVQARVLRCR